MATANCRADALTARTETLDERIAHEGAMHVNLTIAQLYDAIERVLSHYRLSNWMNEHDGALGLVDRLCDHDARNIESGQNEIRLIVDEIYNEVLIPAAFAPSPVEQPAAAPIVRVNRHAVMRLKSICRKLGIESAVPEEVFVDPDGLFAIFGQIRSAIDRLARLAPSPADERAAFEAWAKTKNMDLTPFETTFDSDFTSNAWDGWQARAASANETAAEADHAQCCDTPSFCSSVRRCTAEDPSAPAIAATEAEIRKSMTSEQIQLERKLTCEAIDGAIAFGHQNTNPPPSADHWLAPYWHIGRKQAELESRSPAMAAEAVAWDFRVISGEVPTDWTRCLSKAHADEMRKPDYAGVMEVRDLFDAPQPPAQTDARVGLTDEQREAIDFVIGWYEQSTIADNPYREHIAALRALLATPQPEPREAGAIPRVHGVSRFADNPCTVLVMLMSEATDDALRAIHDSLTSQPEPRAEVTDVQWWLAELDQHGNPKLSDGAHSARAGADKAMYLIKNLGLDNKGKRWAVARVELSEPRPSTDGVNHDAVSACRAMVDAARTGEKQ